MSATQAMSAAGPATCAARPGSAMTPVPSTAPTDSAAPCLTVSTTPTLGSVLAHLKGRFSPDVIGPSVDLHISLEGRGDRTDRIYRQLRDAILDGRLRHGERVPPSRELARSLSVARNTVAAAYDRLVGDGFLAGRSGAGAFGPC